VHAPRIAAVPLKKLLQKTKKEKNMNNAPFHILDPQNPCSSLSIPPSKTALLLLDFHNFILSHQPDSGQQVLNAAVKVRQWAKHQCILVVHCLIDLKAMTPLNRKMATKVNSVRKKMSTVSPEVYAEHALVKATADEYTFYRPPGHVSALGSHGLKEFLGGYGIESLVLTGFSTSGCVINTAKAAADLGFVVTVVEDGCGDRDGIVQEVVMRKLLVGQCHVVTVGDMEGAWDWRGEKEELESGLTNMKLMNASDLGQEGESKRDEGH
jgi:nicotinamidase-related amidase